MATPPTRNEIAGTPTNAEAKAGFGKLWDYVTGLLGLSGDAEAARTALKIADNTMKNRLINAQGLINQRGYVSGTATSGANQYTVDRWRVVTSGQNLTFSTSANEVTFTAPAGGVEQVIEGLNLESGTYVLSWTGTATATVGGSAVTNGGTVTVTGGTNTTVKFSSGTFKNAQFEKGSTATSFDYRPYGTELQLCQRYYVKFGADGTAFASWGNGVANASNSVQACVVRLPVTMRTQPSVDFSTVRVYDGLGAAAISSISSVTALSNSNAIGFDASLGSSTLNAGRPVTVQANNSTSGYIAASAEL